MYWKKNGKSLLEFDFHYVCRDNQYYTIILNILFTQMIIHYINGAIILY